MKRLGVILGVIVLVALVICGIASTKPSSYTVTRSIDIAAQPEYIEPLVDDFHNWKQWSPWEHLDPNVLENYSGPESGVGALYDWDGNSRAGKGHMEITGVTPTETDINLDFIKPFRSNNTTKFMFTPTSNAAVTHVVWTMSGPLTFAGKVMTVFESMDTMIGKDFDTGLSNIKRIAEKK